MNEEYKANITEIANRAIEKMGVNCEINVEDLNVDSNYFAPGYEVPSKSGNEAIRYLARTEGILTDPVYSGKGFAGMLDYIKSGRIPQGSNVVFIHTGGATALFAEQEIIGDITRMKEE